MTKSVKSLNARVSLPETGRTLSDLLAQHKRLAFSTIVDYLDQLSEAIDLAHEQGFIHRSLNPSTILLTDEGHLVVLGLRSAGGKHSRSTRQESRGTSYEDSRLTRLAYTAPEQILAGNILAPQARHISNIVGMDRTVDGRVDLYSLGVILYQMATGVVPFQDETLEQVALKHLRMPPPSPRQFRPDIPLAAEQAILRALAKRPSDRYVRARDLATAFSVALIAAGVLQIEPAEPQATQKSGVEAAHLDDDLHGEMQPLISGYPSPSQDSNPLLQQPLVSKTSPLPPIDGSLIQPTVNRSTIRKGQFIQPAVNRPTAPSGLSETNVGAQFIAPTPDASAPDASAPDPTSHTHTAPASQTSSLEAEASQSPSQALPSTQDNPSHKTVVLSESKDLRATQDNPSRQTRSPSIYHGEAEDLSSGLVPSDQPFAFPESPASPETTPTSVGTQPIMMSPGYNPNSPLPTTGTTGSLALSNFQQGNTGTLKLTGPAKIVQVPVTGQPGLYVTGLLPVFPQQPSPGATSQSTSAQRPLNSWNRFIAPIAAASRSAARFNPSAKGKIILTLALVLMLLVSAMGLFWFVHTHTAGTQFNASLATTPDLRATATARATAKADANIILLDPLSQNIHNWTIKTTGSMLFVFENGAYHITDNNSTQGASALLPDEVLTGSFAYTLTMEEIKGDDTSINNEFGMIIRASSQNKNGKMIDTFYSFEVLNTKNGEYQFWKYDNSTGSSAGPWTKLWHQAFGKEFHQGHGPASTNTFKIFVNGKSFTLIVNGKQIATVQDNSCKGCPCTCSGAIGMLVNLRGTEVAFSNLRLTHS